jgi:hypothetical protein
MNAEIEKSDRFKQAERFSAKALTKYKIVITFTQILSKVSSIYPMNLPPNFSSYQETVNPFAFMDVNLIPFNCVMEVNFHDRLQMMTVAPLAFLGWVFFVYCVFHIVLVMKDRSGAQRMLDLEHRVSTLRSQALYIAILCLYSVFPLVSAVIFQTVSYDRRLPPSEYLKADYSVESNDSVHEQWIAYAIVMGFIYMLGIPGASFVLLRAWRNEIKILQDLEGGIRKCTSLEVAKRIELEQQRDEQLKDDPYLEGLSPLYKDYESKYWWWEIPRFFCTLFLCGLVTVTNFQDGSQIAWSLLISTAMLVAYANCNPYQVELDDKLAQFCQSSLSLAMAVGLLEKANNASTVDDEFQGHSSSFGFILIACVSINLALGFGGIFTDFLFTYYPAIAEKYLFFVGGSGITAVSPEPNVHIVHKLPSAMPRVSAQKPQLQRTYSPLPSRL